MPRASRGVDCRGQNRHQQGRNTDSVQVAGAAVHQTNADHAPHGEQAEEKLTPGGPLLQNGPGRQGGNHRDHCDHHPGEAGGGMEDTVLLPEKVDHRLGQTQRQQGENRLFCILQPDHLPGKEVQDQKGQHKAVAQ